MLSRVSRFHLDVSKTPVCLGVVRGYQASRVMGLVSEKAVEAAQMDRSDPVLGRLEL